MIATGLSYRPAGATLFVSSAPRRERSGNGHYRKEQWALSQGRCQHRSKNASTRATAVDFLQGETPQRIRVRCEIVLSGGAINSPQLLMLSGIADAEALRGHGIAPVDHLPAVGQNLQDHLGFYIARECSQPISLRNLMRPDRAAAAVLQALLFGIGPGTAIPINACAFLRTRPELEIPDIQVTLIPGLVANKAWRRPDKHGFLVHACKIASNTDPTPKASHRIDL
ncbi:MAG: GMC family oxidoreductase N-terminal domain-containing protein, partial [Proteobacteria bacterium]|nr:GMC family oxidoreductase N-terminal domain-containing protein [Pseudomonadota bacterium]